jgi:hypothetical protein
MGITSGTGFPLQRQEFGIQSVSAVSRTTGLPYGLAAIVGDGSIALTASSVDNRGGSSLFPRATEITEIDSMATFNLRTWPDWIFSVFFGAEVSTTAASASTGTVSALTNYVGTSAFDATTGVATATLKTGEAANMKSGWYAIKAASATTVDVYRVTDFQTNRGTNLYFDDDTLKITTSALTIVDAGASPAEIPGTGIELTGGSGTIAMVVDDVALFQVTTPHNGISDIDLGQTGIVFPEHELHIVGKQRGSGETAMIRCYKAQAVSGITIPFTQSDFAATDISVKLLFDDTYQKIATLRYAAEIV